MANDFPQFYYKNDPSLVEELLIDYGQIKAQRDALLAALHALRNEAMHYRNTGVGVQFLNDAIAKADTLIFAQAKGE